MIARRLLKLARRRWAHIRLERMGMRALFDSYPKDAIAPKYHQLFALYRMIVRRRPAVVVELGGGYSTFIIARAALDLAAKGTAIRFFSVDESEYWQSVVRGHMPQALQAHTTFHRADVVAHPEGKGFASLPVERANFVYVDGGDLLDPIRLERDAPRDFAILVEGRRSTVEFLKSHLTLNYRITSLDDGKQTLFERR